MTTNSSGGAFVKGFLVGGAIGSVAALLMAPQSGEETRTQIRETGTDLKERAEATYAGALQKIETMAADLQDKVNELSAKVDEAILQIRGDVSQRAAELAEEAAPETEIDEERIVDEAATPC